MKKLILTLLAFSFSLFTLHAQSWLWGNEAVPKTGSSIGDVEADHSVAVDLKGNAYITGYFLGSLSFGTTTLTSISSSAGDCYIVKYNSSGNVLWAKQSVAASIASGGYGTSLAIDGLGNAYVTGIFQDSIRFGSFTLKTFSGTSMFLAKYDANGNVLWVKQSAPLGTNSYSASVAVDGSGNAYVTGYFQDSIRFGSFTLTTIDEQAWLVKFDANGNVLWARQSNDLSGGLSTVLPTSVAVDDSGNAYVTGNFEDTLSFGTHILSVSNEVVFVVKFDANGNALWVQQANPANNGSSYCGGYSIAAEPSGNVYVTGFFFDTVSFGSNKLATSLAGSDVFLVKYNASGSLLWAEQVDRLDANSLSGFALTTDTLPQGGGYLLMDATGGPSYKLKFGADTFSLTAGNASATYLLQFDSSGNVKCGTVFSEGDEDDGDGIGVDKSGTYVYLNGDLDDTTIFAKDTLQYGSDIPFIARWQPCGFSEEGVQTVQSVSAGVKVYPNPSKGVFTIEQRAEKESEVIEVYNMLGEKVLVSPAGGGKGEGIIDLSTQPSGIYLYRVISESGELIGTGKLIKE